MGSITPGEEYFVSTEVQVAENASDGSRDLRVRVSNEDFTRGFDVPVEVQSEEIEVDVANLQSSPADIRPDTEDVRLSVDVVNNGEKTAENVVLDLELPGFLERTSSFSTREALGNLDPGQSKTASFDFDVTREAPAGAAEIEYELTYSADDSVDSVTLDDSFQLYVEGSPQYEIVNSSADLRTGSSGQLSLTVRNTGSEDSESTRIRVLDSSGQPFTYDSSSQFVGTLEPGQEGSAVFDISTESGAAAQQYLIDFEVRGVKSSEVFTEDKTVPVQVENGESGGSLPLVPIAVGAGILLLVGLFIYSRIRRGGDGESVPEAQEE
jgi:hypothetical protein